MSRYAALVVLSGLASGCIPLMTAAGCPAVVSGLDSECTGTGSSIEGRNETHASVATCERAVAADRIALRDQVFAARGCGGRVIPGAFITAKDASSDDGIHQPGAPIAMPSRFTFAIAVKQYQIRLQLETALLAKAKQAK